jgi:1-acyl-sn-glycerol-3-phosphate acyltransferase
MFTTIYGYGDYRLIRYFWVVFNVFVWTSIWASVGIIMSLFDWSGEPIAWVSKRWAKTLLFISGIPYSTNGLDHLNPDQQYVFIANHESAFDIFLVFASLPYNLVFLAKKELRRIPFLGWAMILGKNIFVDRKNHNAALASMDIAKESLQRYPRSIMIFPEGTRSLDGKMKSFKKGGAILSIQTGLPLVPMAICDTFDVIKKGSFTLMPKPIHLEIGHPIDTLEFSFDERNRVTEILRNQVVNLKSTWEAQKTIPTNI